VNPGWVPTVRARRRATRGKTRVGLRVETAALVLLGAAMFRRAPSAPARIESEHGMASRSSSKRRRRRRTGERRTRFRRAGTNRKTLSLIRRLRTPCLASQVNISRRRTTEEDDDRPIERPNHRGRGGTPPPARGVQLNAGHRPRFIHDERTTRRPAVRSAGESACASESLATLDDAKRGDGRLALSTTLTVSTVPASAKWLRGSASLA
jgi:hypothetical protein